MEPERLILIRDAHRIGFACGEHPKYVISPSDIRAVIEPRRKECEQRPPGGGRCVIISTSQGSIVVRTDPAAITAAEPAPVIITVVSVVTGAHKTQAAMMVAVAAKCKASPAATKPRVAAGEAVTTPAKTAPEAVTTTAKAAAVAATTATSQDE